MVQRCPQVLLPEHWKATQLAVFATEALILVGVAVAGSPACLSYSAVPLEMAKVAAEVLEKQEVVHAWQVEP